MDTNEEERSSLDDILATLTTQQLDFVAVRMYVKTDKEAAERLDVAEPTVYGWPNKKDVNEAVRLAKMDGVNIAREKLKRLASKAVDTIDAAMGDKEKPGLNAALAVLNRVGLPEVTRVEATGAEGGPIQLIGIDPDAENHD